MKKKSADQLSWPLSIFYVGAGQQSRAGRVGPCAEAMRAGFGLRLLAFVALRGFFRFSQRRVGGLPGGEGGAQGGRLGLH